MTATGEDPGTHGLRKQRTPSGSSDGYRLPHSAESKSHRKLLRVMDCMLILLVLLIVIGDPSITRADSELPGGISVPANGGSALAAGSPVNSLNTMPVVAPLDDNTLAAVIAAENSALTPPIYFVDLPLISR